MLKSGEPSNKSRRKFIKDMGVEIVGAYAIPPAIKSNDQNLESKLIDNIDNKVINFKL